MAKPLAAVAVNKAGEIVALSMDSYDSPVVEVIKPKNGIAFFGKDNRFPQHTVHQFENSPTHGAICRYTATLVAGMGFKFDGADPVWVKQLGYERSIDRIGKSWALDLKLHNGFAVQVTWSKDGTKISRMSYVDFSHVRKAVDDNGSLTGYLLCRDWKPNTKVGDKGVLHMPAFNPERVQAVKRDDKGNPILDTEGNEIPLMDETNPLMPKIEEPNQLYYYEGTSPGKVHYPKPRHIAADAPIQFEIEFLGFHVNNILNGLLPSMFMEFFGPEPDESEKDDQQAEIQRTMKGKKGKKAMIFWNPNGPESAMKIHTMDIQNNEARYLKVVEFIVRQIISGHMLASPTLAGLSGSGGLGGNAAEIESAFKLYMSTVVLDMQDQVIEGLQHLLDRSNMGHVKVGIIQRNPFAVEATETVQEGNNPTA